MSIEVPPTIIEVPGRGMGEIQAMRVDAAVREYDERLRFGYNPTNQDWVIYIRYPRDFVGAPYTIDGHPVMPIRGFGPKIPAPHEAVSLLQKMDTWKRQADYARIHTEQHEATKKAQKEKQDAESQEAAERIEHAMRHEGMYTGVTKIFFGSKRRTHSGGRYNVGRREQ